MRLVPLMVSRAGKVVDPSGSMVDDAVRQQVHDFIVAFTEVAEKG